MEKQPTGSELKIAEYVRRIQEGESKDSIYEGLSNSFKTEIDKKLSDTQVEQEIKGVQTETQTDPDTDLDVIKETRAKRQREDEIKIEELRRQLGISEFVKQPPVNYVEVVIDDDYMQKNLMPNNALRMQGGQANWNGGVDLMKYIISPNLSEQHRAIAEDKVEKIKANQEKTYQHESKHIENRENDLTPHVAAENLREFLAFRALDELSAFMTEELYNQDITVENILKALQKAKQDTQASYYGDPFENDAKWYVSTRGAKRESFTRQINQEKYHRIMKQYFKINGKDILSVLMQSNKMPEFTQVVNQLIIQLDELLEKSKTSL